MNCVEMNGMTDAKPIQQPGPCLLLVSPWRKRRSIFTTPTAGKPPLLTYPMGPNPAAVMPNRPPLRIVRLAPFPPFVGPRFPNPQPFNNYGGIPSLIASNPGPMFTSPPPAHAMSVPDNYEHLLQQQSWQSLGHNIFPPTPSTSSEESNADEVTSTNNQQFTQDPVVSESNEADQLNLAAESSGYVNEQLISSDELQNTGQDEASFPGLNAGSAHRQLRFNFSKEENEENNKLIFNNVEERLAAIDPLILTKENTPFPPKIVSPDSPTFSLLEKDVNRTLGTRIKVADDKQEEVVKAAKSLFSKRTRTLYHWMFPDTSKNKLKATVSAAWDTLPDNEKHFYISQVLGRFGLQASSLMINPQLDGLKGLSTDFTSTSRRVASKEDDNTESQRAVDELFASCDDADNWASYPKPKRRGTNERRRKRKSTRSPNDETGGRARLGAVDPDEVDEETAILKRMREAKLEAEFEEDLELSSELEKFRMISETETGTHYKDDDDDDFWRRTPDPEDLFSQMDL